MEDMKALAKKRGDINPKFGTVVVNGVPKQFTAMVASITRLRYADSKVLISGDMRAIKYDMGDLNTF
jgi:hypothetical protein